MNSSEKILRDRETQELEMKSREGDSHAPGNHYSGYVKAGIGYVLHTAGGASIRAVSPRIFLFSRRKIFPYERLRTEHRSIQRRCQCIGRNNTATSSMPILQNALLDGSIGYQSESFHFYGSAIPDLQRTLSDFHLQAGLENQPLNNFPYQPEFLWKVLLYRIHLHRKQRPE